MDSRLFAKVAAKIVVVGIVVGACSPAASSPAASSPEASVAPPPSAGASQPADNTSACGSETVTLTVLTAYSGSDPKAVPGSAGFAGFRELCPNITLVTSGIPDQEANQLSFETASLAAKEEDVVFTNLYAKSTAWLKNGAVIDVAPLIDQWGLRSQLNPTALLQWTLSDGRVQGFPYEGFTWPVWYNKAILQEAGVTDVPKTTDELIAAAAKIRAAGFQPLAVGGSSWSGNKLFSLIIQTVLSDQELIDLYANGNWSDSKVKSAIDLFTKLRDAKVFADNVEGLGTDDMNALFDSGKAAMMFLGSWGYAALPEAVAANVELAGFPLPAGSARDKPVMYTAFSDTGFWISPNGAKKLDAARALISYFYRPEVAGKFVENPGVFMAVKSEFDNSKLGSLFAQSVTDLPGKTTDVAFPDLYVPAEFNSGFERATSLAFTPGTSTDAIVQALLEAWLK